MIQRLHLPFPPTTNQLYANKRGGGRFTTKRYMTWQRAADGYLMEQKRKLDISAVTGPYRLAILLDCGKRLTKNGKLRRIDVDNFGKAVSDWLVKRELIADDSMCEGISIEWGYIGTGLCSVTVMPTNHVTLPEQYRGAA